MSSLTYVLQGGRIKVLSSALANAIAPRKCSAWFPNLPFKTINNTENILTSNGSRCSSDLVVQIISILGNYW